MKRIAAPLIAVSQLAGGLVQAEESGAAVSQDTAPFQGTYAGLGFGAADAKGMTDYPILSGGTLYAPFNPGTGKALDAFVGYNVQNGNLVYGAEARYSNLVRLSDRDPADPEDREVMELADFRGRLGYATGDFLFYGALGWTWAKFRVHPGSGFGSRSNQTSLQGINLSAGVEYNLNDRWFVGGEYTYRDLNGRFNEASRDTDLDVSTVTVRLAYRF